MRLAKKTTAVLAAAATILALGTTSALAMRDGGNGGGDEEDRALCHYPPGNPDNVQIIDPDDSSYPAHFAHGDEFVDEDGECDGPGNGNGGNGNGGNGHGHGHGRGDDCSVSQESDTSSSTGDSQQSGLINLNNIGVSLSNLSVLSNLLCQGDLLNGLTLGVLGDAVGGGFDGGDDDVDCSVDQDATTDSSTGESSQSGLVNANNVGVALSNLDVAGNALCGADVANGVTAAVLGTAIGGDADGGEGLGILAGLLELDFLDDMAGLF